MYIELGDGTFAKEATPDPQKVFTLEELAQEKTMKERDLEMYEQEVINLGERKTAIEAEISEIEALIS